MAEKDNGIWTDRAKIQMAAQKDPMRFFNLFSDVGTPLQVKYIEDNFFPPNQITEDDKHSQLLQSRRSLVALADPNLSPAIAAIDEQLAVLEAAIIAKAAEAERLANDEVAAREAQEAARQAYRDRLVAEQQQATEARKEAADAIVALRLAEAQERADNDAALELEKAQLEAERIAQEAADAEAKQLAEDAALAEATDKIKAEAAAKEAELAAALEAKAARDAKVKEAKDATAEITEIAEKGAADLERMRNPKTEE